MVAQDATEDEEVMDEDTTEDVIAEDEDDEAEVEDDDNTELVSQWSFLVVRLMYFWCNYIAFG